MGGGGVGVNYAKRKIQVALALIGWFHLGVLAIFIQAPVHVIVGLFMLFAFWGVYGLYLFLEH